MLGEQRKMLGAPGPSCGSGLALGPVTRESHSVSKTCPQTAPWLEGPIRASEATRPLTVGEAHQASSSTSPASFVSGGRGSAAYKLFSFTDSAFFFMNHAGSASGLSVCKTTNQEKFDLTQAGKFPSITRGKCWCIRERPRAGDSPRGRGWAGGPVRAFGGSRVGGRHPRAPAAPARSSLHPPVSP